MKTRKIILGLFILSFAGLPGEMEMRYVAVLKVPAWFEPLYVPDGFSFEKD